MHEKGGRKFIIGCPNVGALDKSSFRASTARSPFEFHWIGPGQPDFNKGYRGRVVNEIFGNQL